MYYLVCIPWASSLYVEFWLSFIWSIKELCADCKLTLHNEMYYVVCIPWASCLYVEYWLRVLWDPLKSDVLTANLFCVMKLIIFLYSLRILLYEAMLCPYFLLCTISIWFLLYALVKVYKLKHQCSSSILGNY